MTEDDQESGAGQPSLDQIRIERARPWVRDVQFAEQAALIMRVPDEALLAATIDAGTIQPSNHFAMEMQRRLKDAVEALTAELVMFRESSDGAARHSGAAAGKLARLTWVIIVLTVAVAGLTAALVVLTLRGTG